jgi:hypothetical protein
MARTIEHITDKNVPGFGRWRIEGMPGTYVAEIEAKLVAKFLDERDARLLAANTQPSPAPAKDAQ